MNPISHSKKHIGMILSLIIAILISAVPCSGAQDPQTFETRDLLIVTGTITNAQRKGVKEATIRFFINGKEMEENELLSENRGTYKAELLLPKGTLSSVKVSMDIQKPCYEGSGRVELGNIIKEKSGEKGSATYLAHQNVVLNWNTRSNGPP